MTTAGAILVIVVALGVGVTFVWWCFSGAAAWLDPDPEPTALPRMHDEESHDD